MDDGMRQRLRERFGTHVRFDEALSRHTSFRIGGPADAWVDVRAVEEISDLRRLANEADVPVFVLGGGSNVLVSDRGVRGIVVRLGAPFATAEWVPAETGVDVRVGAAMSVKKLVLAAIDRGLGGLEFAEGIPGRIGGGLRMNAGAFGGEVSQVVTCIEGVDGSGVFRHLPREELTFSYRRLDIPDSFIITHVGFHLRPENPTELVARRTQARRRRHAGQPLGYPNAGSVFKNPSGDYAGRLIEAAGLKGRRIGNAQISLEHANFIVNLGGARAADVRALMDEAVAAVAKAGHRLEPEIKLVGEW